MPTQQPTEFWNIFGRITQTGRVPNRSSGADLEALIIWKVRTLTALGELGVWLLDASVHAMRCGLPAPCTETWDCARASTATTARFPALRWRPHNQLGPTWPRTTGAGLPTRAGSSEANCRSTGTGLLTDAMVQSRLADAGVGEATVLGGK